MKNLLLIVCLLSMPILMFSQTGTVKYTELYSFKKQFEKAKEDKKEELEEVGMDISAFMPDDQSYNTILYYKDNESVYLTGEQEEKATNKSKPQTGIVIEIPTPEIHIYYNADTKEKLNYQNFFDRDFIVESEEEKMEWKIVNEQKVILEQLCMKATGMDRDSNELVIWFAPQIQTSAAPGGITDAPGLILMVEKGSLTITATELNLEETEEDEIVAPEKGKKVTQEKYKKIVEKKEAEMREQYESYRSDSDDGNQIIIIGN